jgi:hypothetical protein
MIWKNNNDKMLEMMNELRMVVDKNDINLIQTIQRIDGIQVKLDNLDQAFNGTMVPSGLLNSGADSSEIEMVKDTINGIRREFFKFKDESAANFTLIAETLAKNADKHDLKELENKLRQKMEVIEKQSIKTKSELRRMIKALEERVSLIIIKLI